MISVQNNVSTLLMSLDRTKRAAFEKYLQSPYFQVEKSTSDWLLSFLKNTEAQEKDNDLHNALKGLSAQKLKSLQNTCLDFLSQFEFDTLTTMKVNLTLAGVRKRNIDKLYKDTLSVIEKLTVKEFDQSAEFYYFRSLIEKNIFELKTENEKKNAKVKIASELNMHKISENTDLFFILEIMKNAIHDYSVTPENAEHFFQSDDIQFCLKAAETYKEKYKTVHLYSWFLNMVLSNETRADEWKKWSDFYKNHDHKIPENEQIMLQLACRVYAEKKDIPYLLTI